MMPRVVVSPAADRDLDEQADYLLNHASLDVALRFLDAVAKTFDFLARHPGVGAARNSRNPRFVGIRVARVQGFEKHLIFYRPMADGLEIVRVLHGHRDIEEIFGPEA
jgi:toxin ParE1/3/4